MKENFMERRVRAYISTLEGKGEPLLCDWSAAFIGAAVRGASSA